MLKSLGHFISEIQWFLVTEIYSQMISLRKMILLLEKRSFYMKLKQSVFNGVEGRLGQTGRKICIDLKIS